LRLIFDSEMEIEEKPVSNRIAVCPGIGGAIGNKGEKGISIRFDQAVVPFLFKLRRYVLVHRTEINKLNSGYSIKLYQVLRGIINIQRVIKSLSISIKMYSKNQLKI